MKLRLVMCVLGVAIGTAAAAATVAAQASAGRNGVAEGIKVHGDWVVEVFEPDGTLVRRAAFSNALTSGGTDTLSYLLLGQRVAGFFQVWLDGVACEGTGGADARCVIFPPMAEGQGGFGSNYTLSTEAEVTGDPPITAIVLKGRATTAGGSLRAVATELNYCEPPFPQQRCGVGRSMYFSRRDLAQVIPVAAGQIVQVTIRFSFS